MTPEYFNRLAAEGYDRIPVYFEINADFETPLSVYRKVAAQPYSYLLESSQGGEQWSRYSFIGLPARQVLKIQGNQIFLSLDGNIIEQFQADDPLNYIETLHQSYHTPDISELPRFIGGLVGYFGYDTVRYVEPKLQNSAPPDSLNTPDILLMESNEVIVFDSLRSCMTLIRMTDPTAPDAYETSMAFLRELQQKLLTAKELKAAREEFKRTPFQFDGEAGFKAGVEKIVDYIHAGDVMQVVLSRRASKKFAPPAIDLYQTLRHLNPSPYMYFMDLDEFQIVSSSPEILARVENGVITNRPLAGTRPRGQTKAADQALEKELLADQKELAEHLMLVDLSRNDVGKVAVIGSVKLTEKMAIERYSHVMHISSNVIGRLLPGKSALDVLRATLPVGTLSGAPKVRAMEIIDELEPVKRGIYGGAVGYLAWNGNMDMAIAIRTAIIKEGTLYLQSGAGVVADSTPDNEWNEVFQKAMAILQAASLAEN